MQSLMVKRIPQSKAKKENLSKNDLLSFFTGLTGKETQFQKKVISN